MQASSFATWLFNVQTTDEDQQRRAQLTIILASGLLVVTVAVSLLGFIQSGLDRVIVLGTLGVAFVVFILAIAVARQGAAIAGAVIIVTMCVLGSLIAFPVTGSGMIAAFALVISVLIGSLLLQPWCTWLVYGLNLVLLTLATQVLIPGGPTQNDWETLPTAAILLGVCTAVGYVGARGISMSFRDVTSARRTAEQSAQELARVNTDLEQRIAARTADLTAALGEVEHRVELQAKLLSELEQQRAAIRELSVPVLPIDQYTLIIPLIGALDNERLQQVQARALHAVEHSHARQLLLDITGVPFVDTQVVQQLAATVRAARLLGAGVTLIGIRPEVAQTIVDLGFDMNGVHTASNLASAMSTMSGKKSLL